MAKRRMEENEESSQPKIRKTFPKILDGTYYRVESYDVKSVVAVCIICNSEKKGSRTSTGNFIGHFRSKHKDLVPELESYLKRENLSKSEPDITNSSVPRIVPFDVV